MAGVPRAWCIILAVVTACICGARTECGLNAQISFLTGVHDGPSCAKPSARGVTLYEAAKLIAENSRNRTVDGLDIGITVLDTCGGITGALKAAMRALVWADINCLHPPYYLGIIGPDTATNTEAVHKVTSILKVPHIVKNPSVSPYLHRLAAESNTYVVQGVLRMIETLKWRSFTLVVNADDENDEDVQNIARKLTSSATAKNLCVMVHDNDEEDYTSRIVHIGKPTERFLRERINATILIVSGGYLKNHLDRINSTNTVLLLEDSRNVIDGLEWRVENSQWWTNENGIGRYDAEELRQVRWLESAVEIYARALKAVCKSRRCKSQINPTDWNYAVSSALATHNAESLAVSRFLDLSMKPWTGELKRLGGVIVRGNRTRIYWGDDDNRERMESDLGIAENRAARENDDGNAMPHAFRRLLDRGSVPREGCATTTTVVQETEMLREKGESKAVLVSGMDDSEWWTMVCTVSGVGIAMFLVGALAVYVVYVNIRGPRYPKDHLDRDGSLRRTGSDRELPGTGANRDQRPSRTPPRRTDSERSDVSEKSV